jgi:hypothetical protein
LSGTVKQFLRDVVDTSIKVDMLCYFARLATTGYYKSDSEWKTLSPAAVDTENSASLAVLPAHGYPAASFPSTQELAAALFHSEQSVHRAACELHSTGALTYCASFGDTDICYMDVKRHSPQISDGLIALLQASYNNPGALKEYLDELASERIDNQTGH